MVKMVGLSRSIKLPWLNKAAEYYKENLTKNEFKDKMNEYLSFEIDSPTVLRKTREILMHLWYCDEDIFLTEIRHEAAAILDMYPEDALAVHWCIMLLYYPVFRDLTKVIGRLTDFHEEIPLRQIKEKLFDFWGERSTLRHSTDKILATLRDIGALKTVKSGVYAVVKHKVEHQDTIALLVKAAIKSGNDGYCLLSELNDFNCLFPFEFSVDKNALLQSDTLKLAYFNGEITVTLK